MLSQPPLKLLVNGCSPSTGNLGVSALLYSLLAGLREREPSAQIKIIGMGGSQDSIQPFGKSGPAYDVLPLNHSRRFYSSRSTSNYAFWDRVGIPMTRIARVVRSTDALLDISAGDSFTDLYGPRRWDLICFLKEAALARGIPLILLPQTYGPFRQQSTRDRAASILRRATAVWSRDAESAESAIDLLRDCSDGKSGVAQHTQGVDLAFALPIHRPPEDEESLAFLSQRDRAHCLIGLNVSGLIYNQFESSRKAFSLKADYPKVVLRLLSRFLEESHVEIALVPHVIAKPGSYESDLEACRHVRGLLPAGLRNRVSIVPACTDPRHVKWYISQFDWFCGTRMHSTIAALSSGVPTASIAYSMKTRGVFETCAVSDEVYDPRVLDSQPVIEQVYESWLRRETTRKILDSSVPKVIELSEVQLDQIVQSIRDAASSRQTIHALSER